MPVVLTIDSLKKLTNATEDDTILGGFVLAAQIVIDTHLTNKGLADNILTLIGNYLSAHFYTISIEGGGITYRRVGTSEERYKTFGYDAVGYMATRFGQTACTFDSTDTLKGLSKKDGFKFQSEVYTSYDRDNL
jgi:hypothetical protein